MVEIIWTTIPFLILIIIANCIAWPLTFILMKKWLANFSQQTSINIIYFIIAGLSSLLIALLIAGYRSYVTTRENPASVLRYE